MYFFLFERHIFAEKEKGLSYTTSQSKWPQQVKMRTEDGDFLMDFQHGSRGPKNGTTCISFPGYKQGAIL